jgi:hypothetical protein
MFYELVARAIVADRVAAANEATRLRRLLDSAEPRPARFRRHRREIPLRTWGARASPPVPANPSG